MTQNYNSRRVEIDRQWAAELVCYYETELGSSDFREIPATQQMHDLMASHSQALANLRFALGESLTLVKDSFRECAKNLFKVFQLKGTEPCFPLKLVDMDKIRVPVDLGVLPDVHGATERDYSLTNPRSGLHGVFAAWIANDSTTGDQIAGLIGDPPNARYIGGRYAACTWEEQILANALRDFIGSRMEAIGKSLEKILTHPRPEEGSRTLAQMLRAIALCERNLLLSALNGHLEWFTFEAKREERIRDLDFFLATWALGLSQLAVRVGIVAIEDLPTEFVFFPREILRQGETGSKH